MAFKRPKRSYDEDGLYDYAVRALGRRMRTVAELKRLMRNRVPKDNAGEKTVEKVVARLKDQRYLNDSSYAATYASLRRDNERLGRRRVVTELKTKGVHPDVIEKAMSEAYANVDEQELARAFLQRRRVTKPENNKEVARIFRALVRAGFGTGVAIKVLQAWNAEDEVLAALEEESADHD